jgi:hypothetical protein
MLGELNKVYVRRQSMMETQVRTQFQENSKSLKKWLFVVTNQERVFSKIDKEKKKLELKQR